MTTLQRNTSSLHRKTAKPSTRRRLKRRTGHHQGTAAVTETVSRRHLALVLPDDKREDPRADRRRSSTPDGGGGHPQSTVAPTRPSETAWENIDKDGCGGQTPWSDAEIAIRRCAGGEASLAAEYQAMHPMLNVAGDGRSVDRYPENSYSTD